MAGSQPGVVVLGPGFRPGGRGRGERPTSRAVPNRPLLAPSCGAAGGGGRGCAGRHWLVVARAAGGLPGLSGRAGPFDLDRLTLQFVWLEEGSICLIPKGKDQTLQLHLTGRAQNPVSRGRSGSTTGSASWGQVAYDPRNQHCILYYEVK